MTTERHIEAEPPWLAIARKEIGVAEIPGATNNPRILAYHACTTLHATDEVTSWCSGFVSFVMLQAGLLSTRSAAARSWLTYGIPLQAPIRGAICVFERPEAGPKAGHVGFALDHHSSTMLELLSGNCDNAVKIKLYPKARLLGVRWPEIPHTP